MFRHTPAHAGRVAPIFAPRLLSLALATALGSVAAPALAQPMNPDVESGQHNFTLRLWNPAGITFTETAAFGGVGPGEYGLLVMTDATFVDNKGAMGVDGGEAGLYTSYALGTVTNSGTIRGDLGVYNENVIQSIKNQGKITGVLDSGLYNSHTIVRLENLGEGTFEGLQGHGIRNDGIITTLINGADARIAGNMGAAALYNNGNIEKLDNLGVIDGLGGGLGGDAITNSASGTITELNNSGRLFGGLSNRGQIETFNNSGKMSGSQFAISNGANGRIGTIVNTGTITGTIENKSANVLTINGGSDSYGTLVAMGNFPVIMSHTADVIFGKGNQQISGDIDMGGKTVQNRGATIRLANVTTITGNYEQGAKAALELGVFDGAVVEGLPTDSGYGRLVVKNNTIMDSGTSVRVVKYGEYNFAQGQRFVAISTAGDAQYNTSSLRASAEGYNGAVSASEVKDKDAAHLVLTLGPQQGPDVITNPGTPGDSSTSAPRNPATTSNASSALGGLFNYQGVNQDLLNVFNPAAALGSTSAANRAGAQLAPSAVKTAASQGAQRATAQSLDIANARLDSMRSAPTGATGVATGETGLQPAMWGQYFGGRARQSERDDVAGYDARFNGLLMGADTLVSENWRVGGMFSYARTNVDNKDANDGSEAKVDSYGLTAYAGYDGRPWYVNVMAGVVRQRYETERDIAYTGFAGHARGKYDGTQYVTSVLAGYPIALSARTTLTPLAGLSYSHLRQDGYTESGGNGAGLKVGSTRANSLKSDLGVKVEHAFDTSIGLLTPSAQLRWRHEFQNSRVRTASSFAADPTGSTAFTSLGATPVKDTGVFVLGATLATNDRLSIGVNYTLEAARGYTSQTGDLRVRYAF